MGLGSLMLDYVQLNGAYLTRALNDDGPLGWSTKALLKLQHERAAGMQILTKECSQPMLEKHTKHFHVLKRLSILKDAGLTIVAPTPDLEPFLKLAESSIVRMMCDVGYDPLCLGLKAEIPPRIYMPLFQLGITDIRQVLAASKDPARFVIVPCSALKMLFPKHTIRASHKRALNALTHILNGTGFSYDPVKEARSSDLTLQQRVIRNAGVVDRIRNAQAQNAAVQSVVAEYKSVTDFHLYEMPVYEVDFDPLRDRQGIVVDVEEEPGVLCRKDKTAQKSFAYLESLPDIEDMIDILMRSKHHKRKRPSSKTSALDDLLAQIPRQRTREAYANYLKTDCQLAELVMLRYAEFNQIDRILNQRVVAGEIQYEVQWAPHPIQESDAILISESNLQYEHTLLEPLPPNDPRRLAGYDSIVHWKTSWETVVDDHARGKTMLEEFKTRRERANAGTRSNRRKDEKLSNVQRQGYWPTASQEGIDSAALDPDLRMYIHIDPNNRINPDKDIRASGRYCIHTDPDNEDLASVFGPSGKYHGSLLYSRLQVLYKAYVCSTSGNMAPAGNPLAGDSEVPSHVLISDFAEAVALLMTRYQDGHTSKGCNTKLKNHWATPDGYMAAIMRGLSITTERFASPLNFTPGMQHYYSLYPEDTAFGANPNAFSCLWTGASQCNPEYEHPEMDKAVRWALTSAKESKQPSLTAFVLPWWEQSAYFRWMDHPMVHPIARIKAKHFMFKKIDYATTGQLYVGNPKWDVNIFVVANHAGFEQYVHLDVLEHGLTEAATEFNGLTPTLQHLRQPTQMQDACLPLHIPKALRKVIEEAGSQREVVVPRAWYNNHLDIPELKLTSAVGKLEWAPNEMWYTDGSAVGEKGAQQIGAGVYCANAGVAKKVGCTGVGPTNTITRAELCALYQCLGYLDPDEDAIIATDSKAIMHMTNNGIYAPDLQMENKHRVLMLEVAKRFIRRAQDGRHTTLVKVKSHTGIKGNDQADELAQKAATEPGTIDDLVTIGGAFDGLYWLGKEQEEPGQSDDHEVFLVSNLNHALKDAARPRYQTGLTNETRYVTIWKAVREDLSLKASNAFWGCSAVSTAARKQVLRARYGILHHMGQAYKMRRPYLPGLPVARNKKCPLCGEEDSTTHILNGCAHPEMKALYIERHNAAGRMMLKERQQGAKGNIKVMADLGSEEKMRGLGAYSQRISKAVISDRCLEQHGLDKQIRKKLRPDLMLQLDPGFEMCGKRKRGNGAQIRERVMHVVEIGYTSEGRYHEKLAEKKAQHQQLQALLKASGFTVHVHEIILGSTGGIFEASMQALAALGIDKDRCKKLERKLHVHSILWLHTIVKKRRQLENGILFGRNQDNLHRRPRKPPD